MENLEWKTQSEMKNINAYNHTSKQYQFLINRT